MTVLTNKELIDYYGMKPNEIAALEAQADAFDKGEWPRGKVTRIGRPPTGAEPTRPLTIRLRESKVNAVEYKAERLGISRTAALREAVDDWLAKA